MAYALKGQDIQILKTIAEYHLLSLAQISELTARHPKSMARRLKQLEQDGLIQKTNRGFGRGRGRPENLVTLTGQGLEVLRKQGNISPDSGHDKAAETHMQNTDHQLLVNWFRTHLVRLGRAVPQLSIAFLSPTSPFLNRDIDGGLPVYERVVVKSEEQNEEEAYFIPDGVFSITDKESTPQKTLLFFLEVDMGSEPLVRTNQGAQDIRQKIVYYQSYFRTYGYKRYEGFWNCRLNGFRLLFLTNTASRKIALCRLVQEMRPSNFIWVADQESMFAKGLGTEIWARGGLDQQPPESILGQLAADCPPIASH